jgi:hypothetical protein
MAGVGTSVPHKQSTRRPASAGWLPWELSMSYVYIYRRPTHPRALFHPDRRRPLSLPGNGALAFARIAANSVGCLCCPNASNCIIARRVKPGISPSPGDVKNWVGGCTCHQVRGASCNGRGTSWIVLCDECGTSFPTITKKIHCPSLGM